MTVVVIYNKVNANQAQYLDRLAAKISAYSSGDLRKYEYLTGEDSGYKPSVVEQAKFNYCPLGKVFNKGLTEDQEEGLLKRVKNIGDKNEKLLKAFSTTNTVGKAAKNESDYIYDTRFVFYRFYRDSEKFKRMESIDSKHGELKEFYKLLSDFKNDKPITNETKIHKNGILNNVNQIYSKYFDTYKTNYNSENLDERDRKKQKSEWTKEKNERERAD